MWKKIDEIGIFNCYQWVSEGESNGFGLGEVAEHRS